MAKVSYYQLRQSQLRDEAIDWQTYEAENPVSWGELAEAGAYFERLGKRYGLIREFRENGII